MKIAILYTSHRQWKELDYAPAFFERAAKLRHQVDVLYHSNNPSVDETALRAKLANIPAKSMYVRVAPSKNLGGYVYGQYEAMGDVWDHVDLTQWDWIVHLHPDLFIADAEKLFATIEAGQKQGVDLIISRVFGHTLPSFATDCFIFKPVQAMRQVFDGYKPLLATPIRVQTEAVLFIEVHRAGVNYAVINRFSHGHYTRDIDAWGIWHEHDLRRIAAYLEKPSGRWKYTLMHSLRHPRKAAEMIIVWLGRMYYGKPQDSLAAQLSRIESPVKHN